MTLVREIPRDDKHRLWEVWEIKVKLRVEGKGEEGAEHPPVAVEVDTDAFGHEGLELWDVPNEGPGRVLD